MQTIKKLPLMLRVLLGVFFSAILLTVIQPPTGMWIYAWIAYVPLILACCVEVKFRRIALVCYVACSIYWLANLYYLIPVTWIGWLSFCLYTGLLWVLFAWGVVVARRKRIPMIIAAPILIVAIEQLQGVILGGFFWRHLSHSQYERLHIIQIADIFGSVGVSFLIALGNGFLADMLLLGKGKRKHRIIEAVVFHLLIFSAIGYGEYRLNETEKFVEEGPMVGVVQSNVPQSVKMSGDERSENQTMRELFQASEACVQAGAKIVYWPETIVPAVLDKRVLRILSETDRNLELHKKMAVFAKEQGAFLLVGATGGVPKVQDDLSVILTERTNTAFYYTPQGQQWHKQYNKIHLVPFGEVIPFKKSWPWMHKMLMMFTPYDYDYTLSYGEDYTLFELPDDVNDMHRFGVLICYEGTVPDISSNFVLDKNEKKQIDWLANISNDGWFTKLRDEELIASAELQQHMIVYAFRAVENRIGILRSVNTGISCIIESNGNIRDSFVEGTLPDAAEDRKAISGWFVDQMPIDSRVTWYSKHRPRLDKVCIFGAVFIAVWPVVDRLRRKKKEAKT